MIVATPAARSLSIIVSFRFQRSTSAPASGLRTTVGAKRANAARARVVTCPVWRYAQITKANPVIPVPRRENVWPVQTRVKARIPRRRGVFAAADSVVALRLRPPGAAGSAVSTVQGGEPRPGLGIQIDRHLDFLSDGLLAGHRPVHDAEVLRRASRGSARGSTGRGTPATRGLQKTATFYETTSTSSSSASPSDMIDARSSPTSFAAPNSGREALAILIGPPSTAYT